MIRPAAPADRLPCRALQTHLPERAPSLLAGGVGTHLVAGVRGAPAGYLLAVGGTAVPDAPDPPDTHLAELVVAPGARREGVGGALLDALLARAGLVTVLVAPENDAARALYDSRGFEQTARRPDAFGPNAPALVLRRPPGRPS